jgi:Uma2 family endonuclease
MVTLGLLGEDDPVELLEGFLVLKMPHNNSHDRGIRKLMTRLVKIVPAGWTTQCQCSVVFDTSKPEPDFSLCRGEDSIYDQRQPRAADLALIIEVSDSSLDRDRRDKARTYGRACVPVYW